MTIKEIREATEGFGLVKNKNDLKRAIPLIVSSQVKITQLRRSLKVTAEALEELSDKCSKYALECPTCFDEAISVSPIGVTGGDITIDGTVYHLAAGYGSPVRIDGECLTQGFLSDLPKDWTKAKLELDTTHINRKGVTNEELNEKGLIRPAKNRWSVKSDADFAE